jgi:hypothetical protein
MILNSQLSDAQQRGMSTLLNSDTNAAAYSCSGNMGHKITNVNVAINNGLVFDYGFPLLGILGSNTSQFFPLHALNTLRLEFVLDSVANFVLRAGDAVLNGYTISNFEFIGNVITLSDEAQSMINAMNPEKVYLKTRTFKQSSATLPAAAGAGNYQLQVGWRASSLIGILTSCYNTDMKEGKFGSICPNLTQPTHFIINGQNYPQRALNPVEKPSSTFASLQKFWGSLSSSDHCGCISKAGFYSSSTNSGLMKAYVNVTDTLDSFPSQFYLGLDTEIVSKRSDTLLSGIDVNSSPIFFNAQIKDALAAFAHTVLFYGYYDVIIEFDLLTKTAVAKF